MKNALVIPMMLFCWIAIGGYAYAQDAKIKTVEFKKAEKPEEEDKLQLTKKEYKEYDPQGRMTKYTLYLANPIGKLVKNTQTVKAWKEHFRSVEVSKFDEMGDILKMEKSFFSEKDNVKTKEEYIDYLKNPDKKFTRSFSYTNFGAIDKVTLLNEDGKKVGEERYKYNRNDEEVFYKKWKKRPSGKYIHIKKTSYNADGFLEKTEIKTKDGKDTYEEEISFKRNKVVEHLKYKNGELLSSFGGQKKKYDPSKSRVLMDFGNDSKGNPKGGKGNAFGSFGMWATEDEFDDNGNKIKTTQTTDGEITQVTEYKYNDNNNLVETVKISYNEGKETNREKEVLEYDRHDNMLKKAIYSNGKLISEDTYDYTYH